jgi:hypothetical protein
MKDIKMILVVSTLMLAMPFLSLAQQEEGIGFSVSFGIGYFGYFSSGGIYGDYGNMSFVDEPEKQSQINVNGDIAIRLDSYIFSFYLAKGLIDPIPYKQANYSEYNLTVGKELINNRWFVLEGHIGVGYFQIQEQYSPQEPIENWGSIGFPFRIKANFYINKHFALGLNPNTNFNFSGNSSIASLNIIGQIIF